MKTLLMDLRYGYRALRRRWMVSVVAVLMIGLGIGSSSAIFSALQALVLRPLPIDSEQRVVTGIALREGFDPFGTSLLEYQALVESATSIEIAGLGRQRSFNISGGGDPERLAGASVSAAYFAATGIEPALGRPFTAADDAPGGPAVAMIGNGLWHRRFGGRAGILGTLLDLDGRRHEIVGVMPPGIDMPYGAEVWTPLQADILAAPLRERAAHVHELMARLRPGVTVEQADGEVRAIARQLEIREPQSQRGWSYRVVPVRRFLTGDLDGRVQRAVSILIAAVALLLIICCANLTTLMLALGVTRQREMGLRLALGASRTRLVRQLMTESLALGLAGGAAGMLLAAWLIPVLAALSPLEVVSLREYFRDFRVDWRVMSFAALLSIATAVASGSIAAFRAARSASLRSAWAAVDRVAGGDRTRRRWFGVLVAGELALAAAMLVAGGLLLRSFQRLSDVDLGFRPGSALAFEVTLSPATYPNREAKVRFMDALLENVRVTPDVQAAGMTTNIPLQHLSLDSAYVVEGRPAVDPASVPITAHRLVTPGYLEALGVSLVSGRLITREDRDGALPVVVVSETLAREAWPGEDPTGKRVRRRVAGDAPAPWLTVVGVVKDVKEDRFGFRIDRAVWYVPYAQQPPLQFEPPLNLLVRSKSEPTQLTPAVRRAIRAIDPHLPVSSVTTLSAHVGGVMSTERFSAIITGALALSGLALAAIGLYGVIAFSVSQRTNEIGVRVALGAGRFDILKLVMGRALGLVGVGLTVGLVGARLLADRFGALLYEVAPDDPATFAVVAGLLSAVGALASYAPARRAARVDPITAIRQP
jgi:putative ABC transport system permease protein